MLSPSLSSSFRTAIVVAALAGTSAVVAAPLPPGGTLDPLPTAASPSGATLLESFSRDFDISFPGPFPFTYHCRATVTQNVYRLPNDTIAFRYVLVNHDNSQAGVTLLSTRDFSDWAVDTYYQNGIGTAYNPDVARRSIDGASISYEYDLSLPTGSSSRAIWVRTDATAYRASRGPLYRVGTGRVTLATGNHSQTLYGFAYPVTDSTPPVVSITGPTALDCACNPISIMGTAYDTSGFGEYIVEYSANANGPWTEIITSDDDVSANGVLATWNTTSISEGYYFVRLTAYNLAEMASTVTSVVYVDKSMQPVVLRSPAASATPPILGGTICFDGTVWDTCSSTYTLAYRALPSGTFTNVNPGTPTYTGQIITDGLGSWSTAGLPDGNYQVRLRGTDSCSHTSTVTREVQVDNTAPVAMIISPSACSNVVGSVAITGRVSDTNIAGWTLQYSNVNANQWTTIASGTTNVNGLLANWDTSRLPTCGYVLRLIAGDASSISCGSTNNQTEFLMPVAVGCPADFDKSGTVNSQDFFDFLTAFFGTCP